MSEIEDDTMFKAKLEIILSGEYWLCFKTKLLIIIYLQFNFAEEETLRQLDKDFQKLNTLSKILDNPALNGKLFLIKFENI